MSILLNNLFLSIRNYFLYPLIFLIIILEIFFQIVFIFDIKSFKKTILFYNPYCDQAYWNHIGNSTFDEKEYLYHPVLTLIKKKNKKNYNVNNLAASYSINDKAIFYGSSFIDHKYFIPNYKDDINFAVKSYGLDQIYQSYILTKDNFPNKNIIIGFLLEDLDRALFNQRNFPKLKYKKKNDNYHITNIPIEFKKIEKKKITFYTYNFFKNLTFLIFNDYDYKKSKCNLAIKKDIFGYFIKNIITSSKKLNQKVTFVTFNFMDDVANPNWRYLFVKDYFLSIKANHLDISEIIREDLINNNNLDIVNYYSPKDKHLNKYGFEVVKKKIDKIIELYK